MAPAAEDELAAAEAAVKTQLVRAFVRKPWREDVARERIVVEAPSACACRCGSRLSKLGEDVTETLEEVPRRFKVIETVRVGIARRSARLPRRSMPRRVASSGLNCWRLSCSTSSGSTSR